MDCWEWEKPKLEKVRGQKSSAEKGRHFKEHQQAGARYGGQEHGNNFKNIL